eukprot:361172-Amphidinium_carterae.1
MHFIALFTLPVVSGKSTADFPVEDMSTLHPPPKKHMWAFFLKLRGWGYFNGPDRIKIERKS